VFLYCEACGLRKIGAKWSVEQYFLHITMSMRQNIFPSVIYIYINIYIYIYIYIRMKGTCGTKRIAVTGQFRKLHNEEHKDMHPSPNIVRVIKRS